MDINYTTVTEVPGSKASQEQIQRLYHRYCFAAKFAKGKDVLEVGCGAGMGLGYLAKFARKVVGGDYTENMVKCAAQHYNGRISLVRLDGAALPFAKQSFDIVILFEAIYYLARPEQFVEECKRVLRPGGILLVCTVNKDWLDFNPSPFSVRYYSVPELCRMLDNSQFQVEMLGGFVVSAESVKRRLVSLIKRMAVALHIMPKTMKGKELFKRLFLGKLEEIKPEVEEGMLEYVEPVPISKESLNANYKIVYAVGRLP